MQVRDGSDIADEKEEGWGEERRGEKADGQMYRTSLEAGTKSAK